MTWQEILKSDKIEKSLLTTIALAAFATYASVKFNIDMGKAIDSWKYKRAIKKLEKQIQEDIQTDPQLWEKLLGEMKEGNPNVFSDNNNALLNAVGMPKIESWVQEAQLPQMKDLL
tara:strand:- start:443 stop:790 length:348 start_codon:yes stop_codon:yes gene_type:complete